MKPVTATKATLENGFFVVKTKTDRTLSYTYSPHWNSFCISGSVYYSHDDCDDLIEFFTEMKKLLSKD